MKRWMGILLTALLLTGCAEQQAAEPVAAADENAEPNSRTVFAMDTVMELSAYGADDALMEAAEQEILGLESRLSVTDAGSEIYALDHNGLAELSPDTTELMQTALEMCERTDGALDVSIYPVLRAWGFTTGSYQVPTQEEIENLLTQVDYSAVFRPAAFVAVSAALAARSTRAYLSAIRSRRRLAASRTVIWLETDTPVTSSSAFLPAPFPALSAGQWRHK